MPNLRWYGDIYIINGIWIGTSPLACQSGEAEKRILSSREGF